jgi:hypothetical protein
MTRGRSLAVRLATKLGLLAVAGLAVMAIAGPSSASASVVCASNLDGDPNIAGRQCPDGLEYGADNPDYAFSDGIFRLKLKAGTMFTFTAADAAPITCNKVNSTGRIADSGAVDGVPNGFIFDIDWRQTNPVDGTVSEFCPVPVTGINWEPIGTNGGDPGIWDLSATWSADGDPGPNGTLIFPDVKAQYLTPQVQTACLYEGDADGDQVIGEGDTAHTLDFNNPSNLALNDDVVEQAPGSPTCPDYGTFTASYVIKGNTDDDGNPKVNDNLFIREDDA